MFWAVSTLENTTYSKMYRYNMLLHKKGRSYQSTFELLIRRRYYIMCKKYGGTGESITDSFLVAPTLPWRVAEY